MAILQKLKSWLPQTDVAPDPLNAETVPNSKRLNRLPLLIFGAACSLVLGVFIYVGYQRSLPRERPQKTENLKQAYLRSSLPKRSQARPGPAASLPPFLSNRQMIPSPKRTPVQSPARKHRFLRNKTHITWTCRLFSSIPTLKIAYVSGKDVSRLWKPH